MATECPFALTSLDPRQGGEIWPRIASNIRFAALAFQAKIISPHPRCDVNISIIAWTFNWVLSASSDRFGGFDR